MIDDNKQFENFVSLNISSTNDFLAISQTNGLIFVYQIQEKIELVNTI